jgi:hypothetical protein
MTIKIINGKRYVPLRMYINENTPGIKKDFIKRKIGVTLRVAKRVLNLNKTSGPFDAFRYKGALQTCIQDLYQINKTIISGNYHLGYSIARINEIYELIVALENSLEYTDELIRSLKAQGNYSGIINNKEINNEY